MESIDKLREMCKYRHLVVNASMTSDGTTVANLGSPLVEMIDDIIGNIEAEIERDYMRLPVDADGVPIHVGDEMFGDCPSGKHVSGRVTFIGENRFMLGNVQFYLRGDYMHHVKPRTLEDVLVDMLEAAIGYSDAHTDVALVAVEKYADEIRELLLGGDVE